VPYALAALTSRKSLRQLRLPIQCTASQLAFVALRMLPLWKKFHHRKTTAKRAEASCDKNRKNKAKQLAATFYRKQRPFLKWLCLSFSSQWTGKAMMWIVKSRDKDGKISAIPKDDWKQAIELRDELRTNGKINAWIELKNSTRVGRDAPHKG
jgi:hypothetical protein